MSEPDWQLHSADWAADAVDLLAVRLAVFVREQGVPPDLELDGQDAAARHLLARDRAGQPIGTARLLPGGQIGRMAVLADWRGRGIGGALLLRLLQTAERAGLSEVFLHAQTAAVDFYQRQGFTAEGEVFVEAGIPHRCMRRRLQA